MYDSRMSTSDEQVGATVKRLRGARSQDALAASMALLGHPTWRRQTVIRTERGERSLKLVEAVTLASILGCTLDDLAKER